MLRSGAIVSALLGVGLPAAAGTVAAKGKSELVEAIASESGLSKADSKKALDGFITTTAAVLKEDGRATWAGFGSFSISKRSARTGRSRNGRPGVTPEIVVGFRCGDELAAALDLIPGEGDERRLGRRRPRQQDPSAESLIDADRLARDGRLPREIASAFLEGVFSAMTNELKEDGRLSLIGFGSFSISKRSARTGRNPQTGKEIQSAGKRDVKFKAGAELSKAVN